MSNNIRILLADDSWDTLDVLNDRLSMEGYSVEVAFNGEEAINNAKAGNFDLIILDIMMPKYNGFEVLEQLRFCDKTRNIPVIICSAKIGINDIDFAEGIGAQGYICKPFNVEELLEQIKLCLSGDLSIRRGFDIAKIKSLKSKMHQDELDTNQTT